MKKFRLKEYVIILSVTLFGLMGCSKEPPLEPEVIVIKKTEVRSIPAPAPEGVVRYCWEEPMVSVENRKSGLDSKAQWYRPAHIAVRKVREGRWRPCQAAVSKSEVGRIN